MSPQSRLVDPTICPDCRAPLDIQAICTRCGLHLTGPLAQRLFDTLVLADGLVGALRAAVPVTVPHIDVTALPRFPQPASPRPALSPDLRRSRATVPVVLLGLGGLCLLVAAVVFVAVAWGALGLGARAGVLLGVTSLLAIAATTLTRRGLWLGAGTVWTVVHLMLAIDVFAVRAADLAGLEAIPWRHVFAAVGVIWLALGLAVARWTATSRSALPASATFAVLGFFLLTAAEAWTVDHPATACAIAVPVLVAATALLARPLRLVACGVAGVALWTWLALVINGVARIGESTGDASWWQHLSGWPLLAATAYAGLVALVRLPEVVRLGSALAALSVLGLLVAGPSGSATSNRLTVVALTLALAGLAATGRSAWPRAAAILTGLGVAGLGVDLLIRPLPALAGLPGWGGHPLTALIPAMAPGAWTATIVGIALPSAGAGLLRHAPATASSTPRSALAAATPAVVGIGVSTTLLAGATVGTASAVFGGALLVASIATWLARRSSAAVLAAAVPAAWLAVLALRLTASSHLLAGVLATALATVLATFVAAAVARTSATRHREVSATAAFAATLLAAYALVRWSYLAEAGTRTTAIALAGLAGCQLVGAGRIGGHRATRLAVEIGAGAVASAALGFTPDSESAALVLTLFGAAAALGSVLHRDRVEMSWVGAALLGIATIVRVADGVPAPERWTLPVAAVLLGAGSWRLVSDPQAKSSRVLGSGLTLALLPSLLLALGDPVSVRGAVLAGAGVAALALGVRRQWAAPFAAGAVTTGALAVRHLAPVAEAVPRWISLGTVGAVLLAVGVTWESRRRNLAGAGQYLADLR